MLLSIAKECNYIGLVKIATSTCEWGVRGVFAPLPHCCCCHLSSCLPLHLHLQGKVLYIANISKAMSLVLMDQKNAVSFSAPWSPDGEAAPTLQNVMFQLPKGKHVEFKTEVSKLQEMMPAS